MPPNRPPPGRGGDSSAPTSAREGVPNASVGGSEGGSRPGASAQPSSAHEDPENSQDVNADSIDMVSDVPPEKGVATKSLPKVTVSPGAGENVRKRPAEDMDERGPKEVEHLPDVEVFSAHGPPPQPEQILDASTGEKKAAATTETICSPLQPAPEVTAAEEPPPPPGFVDFGIPASSKEVEVARHPHESGETSSPLHPIIQDCREEPPSLPGSIDPVDEMHEQGDGPSSNNTESVNTASAAPSPEDPGYTLRSCRVRNIAVLLAMVAAVAIIVTTVAITLRTAPGVITTAPLSDAPTGLTTLTPTTYVPTTSTPNILMPTPAPTPQTLALLDLISSVSTDGNASLMEEGTPQNSAWLWLVADPSISSISDTRRVQRYCLAVLYYSTNGPAWGNRAGWMTSSHECAWFRIKCNGDTDEVEKINLRSNFLQGTIPPQVGLFKESLTELALNGNILTGPIPAQVYDLHHLYLLDLGDNQLTNIILPTVGIPSQLRELYLFTNNLMGTIPVQVFDLINLERLDFHDNKLTGTISPAIGNLSNLTNIDLSDNDLSGTVPSEMGGLRSARWILLFHNLVTGTVPGEVCALRDLNLRRLCADCVSEIECSCCTLCY